MKVRWSYFKMIWVCTKNNFAGRHFIRDVHCTKIVSHLGENITSFDHFIPFQPSVVHKFKLRLTAWLIIVWQDNRIFMVIRKQNKTSTLIVETQKHYHLTTNDPFVSEASQDCCFAHHCLSTHSFHMRPRDFVLWLYADPERGVGSRTHLHKSTGVVQGLFGREWSPLASYAPCRTCPICSLFTLSICVWLQFGTFSNHLSFGVTINKEC